MWLDGLVLVMALGCGGKASGDPADSEPDADTDTDSDEDGDRHICGIGRQLRAALLSPFVGQRLTFFISGESLDSIEGLAEHLARGTVAAAISRQYTLEEVPQAIEAMESGTLTGKAVIKVKS